MNTTKRELVKQQEQLREQIDEARADNNQERVNELQGRLDAVEEELQRKYMEENQ